VVDGELARAADTTVECLGVAPGERFLVVYNPELSEVAQAVAEAGLARTDATVSLCFPTLARHGEEPPPEVAAALLEADAAALITGFSLSHTRARVEATRQGLRVASMPTISRETFMRAVPVDYGLLETVGRRLAAELTAAEACRITAPGGTDVELVLSGRGGLSDDGDLRSAGAFGNLPAGEGYIAPVETEGGGRIVFDGSFASWGVLEEPVVVELEDGRAVRASGGRGAAEWLLETLDAGGENGRFVAELGIGTNPAAAIVGLILEDEKVEGTIHLAFGTSTGIGGQNAASVHIDGLVLEPTVELDGRAIMREGSLL
jgi:leucyl aminopeptidase (aminopeptidase T)